MPALQTDGLDVRRDEWTEESSGWTREVTVKWNDFKLRVTIYRNSYDFQSRLRVDVFNPQELEWNVVKTLSGEKHGDLPGRYTPNLEHVAYEATQPIVADLLGYAQDILSD